MSSAAAEILVVGGMVNLLWGAVTGFLLARVRTTVATAPKYLSLSHVGGLMWAPILFGLVLAVELSDLSRTLETVAAAGIVIASLLLDVKDFLNFRQRVEDEFITKPVGFFLGGLSAALFTTATLTLTVGVLFGL